jgi:hypothetical protein
MCCSLGSLDFGGHSEEHRINIDDVKFYTDSKIILGYPHDETRRFYVYVANWVHHMRKLTSIEQWTYVLTQKNPADLATRSVSAGNMNDTVWLRGPKDFLEKHCVKITPNNIRGFVPSTGP